MVLIGLAIWLALAGLYAGLCLAALAAFVVAVTRRAPALLTRALFALTSALALAPAGCTALYVPIRGESQLVRTLHRDAPALSSELIKPRYLDSLELAYALSFAVVGLAAWLLSGLLGRWASRGPA